MACEAERAAQAARIACGSPASGAALNEIARALFKRPVERALASSLVTGFTRRRLHGKTLILAYHGIVPESAGAGGAGERSLYVTQRNFAAQLDVLAEVASVVPLADIDAAVAAPGDDRVRIAITFDDAYHGAVTCAVDELEARRMSATIFVAPGYLGGRVFWWDALSHGAGHMPDAIRNHALETLAGSDAAIRSWAAESGISVRDDLPAYARSATTDELMNAVVRNGITVGSHTWSHVNVARLGDAELESELSQSLAWLRAEAGPKCIPWLAYPYGLESDRARRAAERAGYVCALRIEGGWHRADGVPIFARPRLNVGAGMSVDGFRARILGSRGA